MFSQVRKWLFLIDRFSKKSSLNETWIQKASKSSKLTKKSYPIVSYPNKRVILTAFGSFWSISQLVHYFLSHKSGFSCNLSVYRPWNQLWKFDLWTRLHAIKTVSFLSLGRLQRTPNSGCSVFDCSGCSVGKISGVANYILSVISFIWKNRLKKLFFGKSQLKSLDVLWLLVRNTIRNTIRIIILQGWSLIITFIKLNNTPFAKDFHIN